MLLGKLSQLVHFQLCHDHVHFMPMFQVREFVMAVQEEEELEIYGGLVKAPKVLADIVESVAAALYVDCNFDLHTTWEVSLHLLFLMLCLFLFYSAKFV